MSGHQVFLVDTAIRPLFSRLVRASAIDKSVEHNNGSGNLRRSEWISSRLQSVEQSARGGKQRGRSAARNGESSGESSRLTILPTPGKSWDSPASTEEVLLQTISHLERNRQRNSELYPRGDLPESDDLNVLRILDLSRGGFPTNVERRRHCHSRRRPSAVPWQKVPSGVLHVHWCGRP